MEDDLATGLAFWVSNDRLITIHQPAKIHTYEANVLLCSLFSGPQLHYLLLFPVDP